MPSPAQDHPAAVDLAIAWPHDRFFWAILDSVIDRKERVSVRNTNARRRHVRALSLGEMLLLESEIPVPIDEVHAIGMPLSDGRVAVVAALHHDLDSLDLRTVRLIPASLPECIKTEFDETIRPSTFNLLIGARLSRTLQTRHRHRHFVAMGFVLAFVALIALGLDRRARRWTADARAFEIAALEHVHRVLGPKADVDTLAITLDRERIQSQRHVTTPRPRDAAIDLASALSAWPSSIDARVHSLTINSAGVAFSLSTEGDPTPLLGALKLPTDWTMEEPRLNTSDHTTRVSLAMHPPSTETRAKGASR
jgi:hypothetical protein